MNKKDDNLIKKIIEGYNKINSDSFTLTRIVILSLLTYFRDGLQFRELKNLLKISDGKLISNINKLNKMGYLIKEKITLDNKNLDVYIITENGRRELEKIKEFNNRINEMLVEFNER